MTTGGAGAVQASRRGSARARDWNSGFPVKAGVRLVGITFIEQNQARNEETLKPRMRAGARKPALVSAVDQRAL